MIDIRQRLLATFQIEHREHVDQIRSLLAMVEKTADQPTRPELEEAFRRAHSLKGAARAVDLRPVEGLAHRMETLFSRVRQGSLRLDKEMVAVVEQVLDASEDCVSALSENRAASDCTPALQAIEHVLGMEPAPPPPPAPAEPAASPPAFQQLDVVRITAHNLDGLLRSSGQLLGEGRRQEEITRQFEGIVAQIVATERSAESARRIAAKALRRAGPSPDFERLQTVLGSMESEGRALAVRAGALRRLQKRGSWTMRDLGKQLQRDVWQARMAPAEGLLEGYRKMVRDLARDEAKEIEFHAAGAGINADRRILEGLKDPVMHLLRNAVSHGIEPPAERAAKGKPASGLIRLRIDARGQRLAVTVEDDGRGVDLSRVIEVAVRQGILSAADAASRSRGELARILFRPGFSTARTVSDLSGRGMGLSVVYEAVRRLQGEVDLQPGAAAGTAVQLFVPLSISTHRFLLTSSGSHCLAIPIHSVERLHRIPGRDFHTVEGNAALIVGGQAIPLVSMRQWLGLDAAGPAPEKLYVMVIRSGGRRAAVVVDAFIRECEAVIQDLGPAAAADGRISSGVLLDDDRVAFVVRAADLLQSAPPQSPLFQPDEKPGPEQKPLSILVVDDSMTTRMLEKSILEAHGYDVRVAVDGVAALAMLRVEKPDLVIADVQMPRLDGFGLIEAMKSDRDLAGIPVIVVTSLERREDRERGLSLGADAYIVKRKFDQEELLTVIRQII